MPLSNDRLITISVGNSRRSVNWQPATMLISEFYKKIETPTRGQETLAEYMGYKKAQQDELKDCNGGFVGGALNGPRRKAANVTGRDIVTLDFDNIPAGGTDDVLRRVEALGCGYCVYSTRKHQAAAPRLRVLLPLDRIVTTDEYEPIARKAAEYIGLQFADPTTFECSRLMYWPSCCRDSQYVYVVGDKPFLSADGLLAQYADWHNTELWPKAPGEQTDYKKLAAKQGDPEAKGGTVGAFCRTYDICRAMDELLPGVYEPVDNAPDRYTFTGGSTTGGAVLYDNGKFLFSHHATDPCSGRLVNAFDMVRLHKFGDLDSDAAPETPVNRMPSYKAMMEYANSLQGVAARINQELYNNAIKDFEGVAADNGDDPANWMCKLDKNKETNAIKATINNISIILENDPLLKGKFALNQFASRGEVLGPLPWNQRGKRRLWEDNDNYGLYRHIETVYQISSNGKVDAALSLHSNAFAFNEVQDYLEGLQGKWDGVPRLDCLFIDYFGAEDNPYNRAVTRKAFTAAVARAMVPGCKFDNMVILSGPQGIGKSTLLDKMSRGWFNDSIRTFEGKEASELLQGVWLVEIGELDAFRRTDVSRIKQFLSLRADRFRAAYGRNVKEIPRSCVFFGTTNSVEYLQDTTGNRRFWPIDTAVQAPTKNVWRDLDNEIDQLWAEAVMRWQCGEPLYLSGEIEKAAKAKQEAHLDINPNEGLIQDFISREIPEDWDRWPIDKRCLYWAGGVQGNVRTKTRSRICVMEIWVELLHGQQAALLGDRMKSKDITNALRHLGCKDIGARKVGPYGSQKCFECVQIGGNSLVVNT